MLAPRAIRFVVEGTECVGHLYEPANTAAPYPVVIMAHGFSGTQQGSLARTARNFAGNGIAAFTFDYRGFGESGGAVRQVVDIHKQQADWRAAIEFVRGLEAIDRHRIAIWGSSLSGAHVVEVAAQDEEISAVVAQVPFNGFPDKVEGRSARDNLSLLWAAVKDRVRGWLGLQPLYVTVVGRSDDLAVIATDRAEAIIASLQGTHWQNKVAPRVILDMAIWYRPSKSAHRLRMPILVCLAERDEHTPPHLGQQIADAAPHAEVLIYPCTHFDFYEEAIRQRLVRDQTTFLKHCWAN
ncbi:alpha/beta hydrolase [Nitratireductor thuwali]|uniref:2,6-dihydropseudooxynicotine hydrolase n=1 Tax=Nitratireductor thuwali TaxID=2267699 RepID=A0ABY5MEG9_9HYPH|nr:2,6-dihydropseudooxynicotine hydrolase [Nitratireductor thuwali]